MYKATFTTYHFNGELATMGQFYTVHPEDGNLCEYSVKQEVMSEDQTSIMVFNEISSPVPFTVYVETEATGADEHLDGLQEVIFAVKE